MCLLDFKNISTKTWHECSDRDLRYTQGARNYFDAKRISPAENEACCYHHRSLSFFLTRQYGFTPQYPLQVHDGLRVPSQHSILSERESQPQTPPWEEQQPLRATVSLDSWHSGSWGAGANKSSSAICWFFGFSFNVWFKS